MDIKKINIQKLQQILNQISPTFNTDSTIVENLIECLKLPFEDTIREYQKQVKLLKDKIKNYELIIEEQKKIISNEEKIIDKKDNIEQKNYDVNCNCLYCKIITFKKRLEYIANKIYSQDKKISNDTKLSKFDNLLKTCELENELLHFKINTINSFNYDQNCCSKHENYYNLMTTIDNITIEANEKLITQLSNRLNSDLSIYTKREIDDIKYQDMQCFNDYIVKTIPTKDNISILLNLYKRNYVPSEINDLIKLYRERNKRLTKELKSTKQILSNYIC